MNKTWEMKGPWNELQHTAFVWRPPRWLTNIKIAMLLRHKHRRFDIMPPKNTQRHLPGTRNSKSGSHPQFAQNCNSVKLIVCTQNIEDIVQNERSFMLPDTTAMSHYVANVLFIPYFFEIRNNRWIEIAEITAQFRRTTTASMPPTFLLRTQNRLLLPIRPLIANSSRIPQTVHGRELPSVKMITKVFHMSQHREWRIISNIAKR